MKLFFARSLSNLEALGSLDLIAGNWIARQIWIFIPNYFHLYSSQLHREIYIYLIKYLFYFYTQLIFYFCANFFSSPGQVFLLNELLITHRRCIVAGLQAAMRSASIRCRARFYDVGESLFRRRLKLFFPTPIYGYKRGKRSLSDATTGRNLTEWKAERTTSPRPSRNKSLL